MEIVVTVKQVPDPNFPPAHIQLDPAGRRIAAPFGVPPVMNGYDANALEEALRLKERYGGRVSALSLGDEACRPVLKRAVGMGADYALLLGDESWLYADSGGIGAVIAAAVRKLGMPDLVLCGRQSSDTDGGQVLFRIGHALGFNVVTPVSKIESVEDGALVVQRQNGDTVQRLRVRLPALLGISSEINEPRNPSMRGLSNATRMRIPRWTAADLEVSELPARVTPRQVRVIESSSMAELVDGESDAQRGIALAERLHAQGLI
jgi:electron transfer flavoprotein beta subunit